MHEFQPCKVKWVTNVLCTSAELQVSKDGTKVHRHMEVQKPKNTFDRSVYAKGFGEEASGLQHKPEQFFSKQGRVAAVHMQCMDGINAFKVCLIIMHTSL
ncbi:hypothetical protein EI94DRAFT_1892402, partial [Lactarius quietus]